MLTGARMAAAASSLRWRTCGSRSPTMRRVGACTRARALPARSGRPPREMTSRTRSGRSAAVINAAAAPVLAPKSAKGSWAVSLCCPSQSAAPVNLSASRTMSNRSSRVRRSTCSSWGVSRSRSKVAQPRSWRMPATRRFRGLWRLLPLPCAKSTTPRVFATGTARSPSSETPAVGTRTVRSTILSVLISPVWSVPGAGGYVS